MPYLVVCKGCTKKLRVPDMMAGKTIKCPSCARQILFKPKPRGPVPKLATAPAMASSEQVGAKSAQRPASLEQKSAPAAKSSPATAKPQAKAAPPADPASANPSDKPAPAPKKAPAKTQVKTAPPETMKAQAKPAPAAPDPIPEPPPPVTKPPFTPPKPAPKKKTDDDDEEGRPNKKLLIVGGVVLAIGVLAWLFTPGGAPEGSVSGKLTLEGEPLAAAQVVFVGEDEKNRNPIVATTDDAGTYKLIGPKAGGIPPGKYKITVTRMVLKDGTVPDAPAREAAQRKGTLKNSVLDKYKDVTTTDLTSEVKAGSNKVDLDLKKK